MSTKYEAALAILETKAKQRRALFNKGSEIVPLEQSVGRLANDEVVSQIATPPFDTSAMDGYAVNSFCTASASKSNPLILLVKGTMAAGDEPLYAPDVEDGFPVCVEIMTGAQFPKTLSISEFDACIRVEDTESIHGEGRRKFIRISDRVPAGKHRRLAGNDLHRGDIIISRFQKIGVEHIMACASVGFGSLRVLRKPRVALWCTGAELSPHDSIRDQNSIRDCSSPYIVTLLRQMNVDVDFLGFIEDDISSFTEKIGGGLSEKDYDLVITTGAVSAGKYDIVRDGLEALGATIGFHGVAVRPGRPVLFATLPSVTVQRVKTMLPVQCQNGDIYHSREEVDFFGLPGNPIASAACLRFFVLPYLQHLTSQPLEPGIVARIPTVCERGATSPDRLEAADKWRAPTRDVDLFLHGQLLQCTTGAEVIVNEDQSPGKTGPLFRSNCWVHLPRGDGEAKHVTDLVRCFPMAAS